MDKIVHSHAFLRKRKFMMVLPLLVLPFITFFFIALGGGRRAARGSAGGAPAGINTLLPDPHFKKGKDKDKLALYEERNKDSAKKREAIKNDPYYHFETLESDTIKTNPTQLRDILEHNAKKYNQPGYANLQNTTSNALADSNEQKVVQKLNQLKKILKQNTLVAAASSKNEYKPETGRSQNLIQQTSAKTRDPDPEVSQLNTMLDKVMLIQHPEKMQDSMKKLAEKNKTETFTVSTSTPEENVTMLGNPENEAQSGNAFYGLSDESDGQPNSRNCIEAIIPETESLVSGATVKLRLLNDIYVGGFRIPKDELVYGIAFLNNERLKISIGSLRYQNNILPVSLAVYDMDGMAGIYIPGSMNRDVSKESAGDAISTLGLTTVDESVGAQAAVAGIQAAKTLAGRKIRLIRVTVKSGYRVLLKDGNAKETRIQ